MRRVVIRMPNWLGDLIMATPIIEEAKKRWPDSTLTALCKPAHMPLLQNHPFLDAVLPFSKEDTKRLNFDIGLLLPNSFSSAWHFYRCRIRKRIGFSADWRRLFLTHPITRPKEKGSEHLVDTYKRLLGAPFSDTKPLLYIKSEEKKEARAQLRKLGVPKHASVVGVNATAAYGPAKCWLPDRFKELTTHFPDTYFLFFGDEGGVNVVNQICRDLPASVINLAGKTTLRQLMAFLTCCDAFVTNDSGPMHVAAALKVPLVAIFGSTNEIATGPYKHGKVIHKHVPCSPCYKRHCPIDFRCMTNISVEEVAQALRDELNAGGKAVTKETVEIL